MPVPERVYLMDGSGMMMGITGDRAMLIPFHQNSMNRSLGAPLYADGPMIKELISKLEEVYNALMEESNG